LILSFDTIKCSHNYLYRNLFPKLGLTSI